MAIRHITPVLGLLALLLALSPSPVRAGVQVAVCQEDPTVSGIYTFRFFACTAGTPADALQIELVSSELQEGSEIMGCNVPNLPGYSASFLPSRATFAFPLVSPFSCVPGLPGVFLEVIVRTQDVQTLVTEKWLRNGQVVSGFGSILTCPPVSVEQSTWGSIKALYR